LHGLDERIARRRALHRRYREAFEAVDGLDMMPVGPSVEPNYWLTCIVVDPSRAGIGREDIRLALESQNVESRPVWKPLHLQPLYRNARSIGGMVAENIFEQGLCLPSGSALSSADQDRIIAVILDMTRRAG